MRQRPARLTTGAENGCSARGEASIHERNAVSPLPTSTTQSPR